MGASPDGVIFLIGAGQIPAPRMVGMNPTTLTPAPRRASRAGSAFASVGLGRASAGGCAGDLAGGSRQGARILAFWCDRVRCL
jgi:hypothetical protein